MNHRTCPTCGNFLPGDAPESLCPRCLLRIAMDGPAPAPQAFVPPPPRELAPLFPQLEIIALIGRGGMGAVYKARQVKLDRIVALKILPPQTGEDPAFAERFMREGRALAKLQHPNIVTIYDFGEAGGFHYLLMEYVEGGNLRRLMRQGPMPAGQALPILTALGEALQFAHQNEVVHRDLKPENILVDRHGQVKLADFGLAKLAGPGTPTLTEAHHAMGTPHYMAPEQLERPLDVDHRADLYSLGVVAYELLAGELPLGRFDPPSQRGHGIDDHQLDPVIMRALERDPAKRFQAAREFLTALRTLTGPATIVTRAPVEPTEPETPADPITEVMVMIGILLGVIVVILGVAMAKSGWFALGLLAVERVAASIAWRPDRRTVIGSILALGGLAASAALIVVDPKRWWILILMWFWYGSQVSRFFKGSWTGSWGFVAAIEETVPNWADLSPREQRIARAIYDTDEDETVTWPSSMEGEDLAKLRDANELLPEERVLAHVSLSDETETTALIFGSQHVYFPAMQNGEPIRCSLAYESMIGRTFVNHGKSVFAGDGLKLTPENEANCETLATLLNAVRRAVEVNSVSIGEKST